MIRKWEFIPGFEEYMITDQGEVFRYSEIKFGKAGEYQTVSLSKQGKKMTVSIHKLVLEIFVCKRPNDCVAHHKDEDKSNNSVDNLEWVTRAQHNILHPKQPGGRRKRVGVACDDPYRGERVSGAKLTESKVKLIRMLRACKWLFFSIDELAGVFDVTQGTVSKAISRKTWAHVV